MKKTYSHPLVYVENTRLAVVTASMCGTNVNSSGAVPIPDGMDEWETVFTDSNLDCFYKVNLPGDISLYDPNEETFCYQVPSQDTKIFSS